MTAKANARSAIFVSAALVIAMGAPASAQAQTCGPSQLQLNHDARGDGGRTEVGALLREDRRAGRPGRPDRPAGTSKSERGPTRSRL